MPEQAKKKSQALAHKPADKKSRDLANKLRKSKSPVRKTKSKSPVRKTKSKSPVRHSKPKTPVRKTKSKSPVRKTKSKSPVRKTKSRSPARKTSKSPTKRAPRMPGGKNSLPNRLARKVEKARSSKKIFDISNINKQTGKGGRLMAPYSEIGRKRSNKKYVSDFPVASDDAATFRWFIETIGDPKNNKYVDIFEELYGKGKVHKPTKAKRKASPRKAKTPSPKRSKSKRSTKVPKRPSTFDTKKKIKFYLPN